LRKLIFASLDQLYDNCLFIIFLS